MNRRTLLGFLAAGTAAALTSGWAVEGEPRRPAVRRHRRAVRRRVRRRIRRRVTFRMIHGRRVWVVPVGLAPGWELVHENRVVVVRERKFVEIGGARTEVVVVEGSDGKTEQVEIAREDTPENRENLEGSILPDSDKATPGVESEVEGEQ